MDRKLLPVLVFALTASAQDSSQFTRRDVMIPTRDGVKLHTVIFRPKIFTPMIQDAKAAGQYKHEEMGRNYNRISIVTVREIIEDRKRLEMPMSLKVLKGSAKGH